MNGHTANKELVSVRYPLLEIKDTIFQFHIDKDTSITKIRLEKLAREAESYIHHYESTAIYNDELRDNVVNFTLSYNRWVNAEKRYINQIIQSQDGLSYYAKDQYPIIIAPENNAMFLSTIQLLSDAEVLIHNDITKGQKSLELFQWACVLFIVYFIIAIISYQRNSNKEHMTREKNLETTLRSIGEAVIVTDINGCIVSMNPKAEHLTGRNIKDAKGFPLSEVFRVVNSHSGMPVNDVVDQVRHDEGIVVLAEDSMLITANGDRYEIRENGAPVYDDTGAITGVVLVFRDVTQEYELINCLSENLLRLQGVTGA